MNLLQSVWFYIFLTWLRLGCALDIHIKANVFDGACACVDLALANQDRADVGALPEWSS